jgi:transcriptional regulator with XRE-family HTH domain
MDWSESGKDSFARSIGERIRELRLRRGFRSVRELAAAIPNARLSAKVVSNIELGRKLDLTVVELLELSRALGVAPQQILVDHHRPYEPTGIPGVSEEIATMSAIDFLEWLPLPFEGHQLFMDVNAETPEETAALVALRSYEMQRREVAHHTESLARALQVNRKFAGFNDLGHLRNRVAESFAELRRMASFLEQRGVRVPADHCDHSLTTTPGANDDRGDHIDHTDHRNSASVSAEESRR